MRSLTAERFAQASAGITEQVESQYDDLLDFRIGDPDLTTSEEISKLAFKDAINGYTHYMGSFGDPQLIQELISFYKEEYGISCTEKNFMVTASGSHAMWLAMQATLNPGDEVIITDPCFDSYPMQIRDAGGIVVRLPLKEDENWQINITDLEKRINGRTRGIVLNTPNNPCAVSYSDKLLKQIAELAIKYDLLVYADDIYTIFTYAHPFLPISSLPGMKERTITVRSFSKDYVMTGWRLGFIEAKSEVIKAAGLLNGHIVYSAPSVSQRAALHALQLRKKVQPIIKKEFQKRAETALQRISRIPWFSTPELDSSIYLFPSIKRTGLTSTNFCDKLMREAHVGLFPGSAFGSSGEGYVRIALTCSEEKINEAFDRIDKIKF